MIRSILTEKAMPRFIILGPFSTANALIVEMIRAGDAVEVVG
jgi:hypothetical protein